MTRRHLKMRLIVHLRDKWCVRCGTSQSLQVHHRRVKGMGGDGRDHTDCPCNLLLLCAWCHADVHSFRREAEAEGYIIASAQQRPEITGVMRRSDGGGVTQWPTCTGEWISEGAA